MNEALYIERRGTGNPLVLLHGWGMNLRVFDGLIDKLAAHHAVIAIDLPGHGKSPWSVQLGAQYLSALAAAIPRGANLLGWSLGGQLALQLAGDASLALSRLVLITTTPRFVRAADWAFGVPQSTVEHFVGALRRDPKRTIADFLELQVRGSADAETVQRTLEASLTEHGSAQPAALEWGLSLLETLDLRAQLAAVTAPALVITGQYDRVTPPQAGEALSRALPRGQLLALRRAGHAPFLSHRDAVLDALMPFLEST